jgi:hypothetical protein
MQPAKTPTIVSEETAALTEYLESTNALLQNIKRQLPRLEDLLAQVESHWGMEDGVYRFYHQSFKVYAMQELTVEICRTFRDLLPGKPLNRWFTEIVTQGTGNEFEMSHNQDWLRHTRPIIEAFFHAHYFLKMAVKYGKELESSPDCMPSGWAAVLYLYDSRSATLRTCG